MSYALTISQKFGGPLCVSYGLSEVIQPPNVFPVMQQFVAGSDIWLKAALRQALTTVKVGEQRLALCGVGILHDGVCVSLTNHLSMADCARVCACVHVCMCACKCVRASACVRVCVLMCVCACVWMHVFGCMCLDACVWMHVCVHVCGSMCVCMCLDACVCAFVWMHVFVCARTWLQSSVIALAFLHRHISVEQTTEACRVEEEFQVRSCACTTRAPPTSPPPPVPLDGTCVPTGEVLSHLRVCV